MSVHISTEEAKRQGISGSDVYRFSHLLYHDNLNRDFGVVHLCVEAFKAFSDTVALSRRSEIAEERKAVTEWFEKHGFESGIPYPWGQSLMTSLEFVNYENLKIASGFELYLKSRLLSHDLIIHEIDHNDPIYSNLAQQQKNRPISKNEVIAIQGYHFDGRQNYLPGLKDSSIKFSFITKKPAYRSALDLTKQELDIIDDFRRLRNQIHFPGDFIDTPNISAYPQPIVEFITGFINSKIVNHSNELIRKYSMKFKELCPFA